MSEEIKTERKYYADKLSAQIKGIEEILSINNSNGVIDEDMKDKLREFKEKAVNLKNKIEKNEFEVAIIGLEKAGKSTFANAFMGNVILPTADERCTYTSTNIRYGDEDTGEVEFYTRGEFEKSFLQKLETLTLEKLGQHFSDISKTEYEREFSALPDNIQREYSGNINEDIKAILTNKDRIGSLLGNGKLYFNGAEKISSSEFQKYIVSPEYSMAVKNVTIKSSRLSSIQNAVIYDVPGFDSPTQIHMDQTKYRMQTADVIILVASGCAPSLTGPQLRIFDTETDQDGIRFGDKLFVFANKTDRANGKVENNIKKLKEELKKYRIIYNDDMLSERVVAGSARAFLEKEEKLKGDECIRAIKARGITDGINEMLYKLKEYNENERFDTLKKRVNRNLNDIQKLFENIMKEQEQGNTQRIFDMSNEIVTETLDTSRDKIKKALEEYDTKTKSKYNADNLLTKKLINEVVAGITVENFGVTPEELEEGKNRYTDMNSNFIISKIESPIREKKYENIYSRYINDVIDLSAKEHDKCDSEIEEIFIDSLGIKNSRDTELLDEIKKYINKCKGTEDNRGYYRSLVERFSMDIFEILLRLSLGDEARWNRFESDKNNFYSLVMFNREENMPLESQPLFYKILFHDAKYDRYSYYISECVNVLIDIVGTNEIDKKILGYVSKIVLAKFDEASEFIKNKCKFIKKGNVKENSNRVSDTLCNEIEIMEDDSISVGFEDITKEYYKEYFKNRKDKTIEDVREQINKDICILHDFLESTAVKAINIEKSFLAREHQIIMSIISSLDPQERTYRDFINSNIYRICSDKYEELNEAELKNQARRNTIKKIKEIIAEMKKIDTAKQ